jgi:DnaJ-class molecular chaperone
VALDPYQVLGVTKNASDQDIRKAYHKLAKKHHPDLNPGKREAEDQFKQISAAYDLLGDPEKRARFDRGEIDAAGAERPPEGFYRYYADQTRPGGAGRAGANPYRGQGGFEDFDPSIFADIFGQGPRSGAGNTEFRMRGGDVQYELTVDLLDAVNGATKRVTMPDGKTLDLTIPAGIDEGRTLRLRGQGHPGLGGAGPGDAYVAVHIAPHPVFERKGSEIHINLPVTLGEAVLGGKVRVPTPTGAVTVTVPKGSNTGTVMRLRGKGLKDAKTGRQGDAFVHLQVTLPDKPDPELEALVRQWQDAHAYDPRAKLEAAA